MVGFRRSAATARACTVPAPEPAGPPPGFSPGIRPCSGLGCTARTGSPCSYIDRRGRSCGTAWCPAERSVVNGRVYCSLHAHTICGIEHEYGSSVHPDVNSRTVAVMTWMAAVAADDIVAVLNFLCILRGELLVTEPIRRVFHAVNRRRVWEKQWKVLSPTGVTLRVCLAADEQRPDVIEVVVNNETVARLRPSLTLELEAPSPSDLEWLTRELVQPVADALESWITPDDEEALARLVGHSSSRQLVGSRR